MTHKRKDGSPVLAFRIFVMLSCLIIVPMAAIFGSAFPDVVKSVLVDRVVEWATGKSPEAKRDAADSGFGTVSPAPHGQAAGGKVDSEAPKWDAQTNTNSWQGQSSGPPPAGVIPAAAVGTDPAASNQQASYTAPIGPGGHQRSTDPRQAPTAMGSVAPPAGRPSETAGGSRQPDPFTAMERKLREYGATYYLLETWGNNGELFRFHCKMAIGNNPNYTRHFEATDSDALRAMGQVLDRVEAWRGGRPQ